MKVGLAPCDGSGTVISRRAVMIKYYLFCDVGVQPSMITSFTLLSLRMLRSDVNIWNWTLVQGVPSSSIDGHDIKITYFVMLVLNLQWSLQYFMLSLSILDFVKSKRLAGVCWQRKSVDLYLALFSNIMVSFLFAWKAVMFTITYFVMWVLNLTWTLLTRLSLATWIPMQVYADVGGLVIPLGSLHS